MIRGIFSVSPFLTLLLCGCGGQAELGQEGTDGEQVLYRISSRVSGFDPVKSDDVDSSLAIAKIYEGLLQYAYLDRPYRVEPCLAASMPEISKDGLNYTFHLKKGIHFQDDECFPGGEGRELVADDFVYSIKRSADLKNASNGYWAFNNRIVGLDEFREISSGIEPTNYDLTVEGLKALDRYTFQIKLLKPYPQLMWIMAMHYAFAVPREAVEYYGDAFVNHPVGTGPYMLKSWTRNYRMEFVRNPAWGEHGRLERYPSEGSDSDREAGLLDDAGTPLPIIDRIVQYPISDGSTQWMMFLAGQFSSSSISRDNWDAVVTPTKGLNDELAARGIALRSSHSLDLFYIGFNMYDPVLGAASDPEENLRNKKLRQALSCAFDHKECAKFYNDRVAIPTGPIPDPMNGYRADPLPYSFDLERAAKLLAEAGYPEGKDPKTGRRLELAIEVGNADSTEVRQFVELFVSMMDKIGVKVNPSYNNWPSFLDKMDRRQAQMFTLGWVADYPDAENYLQLFYSKNESPGPNHCNYKNEEFDRLYGQIRTMLDSPERTAIYERMADIVIEDAPWIFTYQRLTYALTQSWLKNFKIHIFPYGMTKYRRIDPLIQQEWKKRYREKRMNIAGQDQ
ncbi:MAG: hypothetical protein K9M45_12705 [Kiritimatiellales bacterium]|nr:hypothetical protein [Kiritimatiellales bacterium]